MSMQKTECPQCGYCLGPTNTETGHPRSRTTNETAGLTRSEGELSTLHTELLRLENSIEKLCQDRSAILSKINNIQAETRYLPAEVLSSIFAFARPPIDFDARYTASAKFGRVGKNMHFVLASVCHSWRQVVLSTAQLWTTVALRVEKDSSFTRIISFLNLHFERARGFPISLDLEFSDEVYEPSGPGGNDAVSDQSEDDWRYAQDKDDIRRLEAYEDYLFFIQPLKTAILVEAANKIQLLSLVRAPYEWLLSLNGGFTQCTTVMIFHPAHGDPGTDRDDHLDLTTMPCLRHVDWMSKFDPPPFPNTLTILRLRHVEFVECYSALKSYSNLVEFEMTDFDGPWLSRSHCQINGPLVFPQLEHFGWKPGCNYAPPLLEFLRHVRFPKLRSLHWSYTAEAYSSDFNYDHHNPFFNFFSNLPPTLSSLTILGLSHLDDDDDSDTFPFVQELLHCVPQVSKFHLDQCGERAIDILVDVIGRPLSLSLAPDTTPPNAHQNSVVDVDVGSLQKNNVLPHLRELVIGNPPEGEGGIGRIDLEKIGKMLEALRVDGRNGEEFRLVLGSSFKWCYDLESLLHLRTVARGNGFDLTTFY